jgi:hypothetical protein
MLKSNAYVRYHNVTLHDKGVGGDMVIGERGMGEQRQGEAELEQRRGYVRAEKSGIGAVKR